MRKTPKRPNGWFSRSAMVSAIASTSHHFTNRESDGVAQRPPHGRIGPHETIVVEPDPGGPEASAFGLHALK